MRSPVSPVISNFRTEFFEQVALTDAKYKPALWVRQDFHNLELQSFLDQVNNLSAFIRFSFEMVYLYL
jgi:hypothetical protein